MIQAWLEFLNSNWFDQSTFNIILNSVIGCGQQSTPKLHLLLVRQLFFLISWFMFSVYKLELFHKKKIVLNDLFTVMIGFFFKTICLFAVQVVQVNISIWDFWIFKFMRKQMIDNTSRLKTFFLLLMSYFQI